MTAIKADLVNATKRLDGNSYCLKFETNFLKSFTTFLATQEAYINAQLAYAKQSEGKHKIS